MTSTPKDMEAELAELRRKVEVLSSTPAGKRALAEAALRETIRKQMAEVEAFIAAEPGEAEAFLRKMTAYRRRDFIERSGLNFRELAGRASTMSDAGKRLLLSMIDSVPDRLRVEVWSEPPVPMIRATLRLRRGEREGTEVSTMPVQTDEIAYNGFQLDGFSKHFESPRDWADRLEIDRELAELVESGRVVVESASDDECRDLELARRQYGSVGIAGNESARPWTPRPKFEASDAINARTKRELEDVLDADAANKKAARIANHAAVSTAATEATRRRGPRGE